jgi:protoporphyrinogen oxidase
MDKKVDILILGGGITGLSLGSFLGEQDYLIAEKDETPGGYCRTTERNGFVWDYSGHFFHFKNEEIKNYLLENIDCKVLDVKKISHIHYNKRLIDFPFQTNINQLDTSEFDECLKGLEEVDGKEISFDNFKSHVISKLGEGICNKFVIPYNEKLYACDLNSLDANAMGRFFPQAVKYQDLLESFENPIPKESYNDNFIYPVKGSFEFVKSILKRIPKEKILTKTRITGLNMKEKVAYTPSGEIRFNKLVNTIPFNTLLSISGTPDPELTSNKVAVFNIGFHKGTDIKSHWIYFPGNEIFYRVGFYNNILGSKNMSLYVEIGMKGDQASLPESSLLNAVIRDLKLSGIVTDQKIIDHEFIIMNPAYAHITEHSQKAYDEWCETNNPNGFYSIGRYGSWTYCSIEDNILQAKKLFEKISNLDEN